MARPIVACLCYFSILHVTQGWKAPPVATGTRWHRAPPPPTSRPSQPCASQHPPRMRITAAPTETPYPSQLCATRQPRPPPDAAPARVAQRATKRTATPIEPPIADEIEQLADELTRCLQRESSQHDDGDDDDDDDDDDDAAGLPSSRPLDILKKMMSLYTVWITSSPAATPVPPTPHLKFKAAAAIDAAFRLVTNAAFGPPYRLRWVNLGMEALQLQLHASEFYHEESLRGAGERGGAPTAFRDGELALTQLISLPRQYAVVAPGTWRKALRALTSDDLRAAAGGARPIRLIRRLNARAEIGAADGHRWLAPPDAAFRILQRLVHGRGVRTWNNNRQRPVALDERDFNMVLHAYARASPRPRRPRPPRASDAPATPLRAAESFLAPHSDANPRLHAAHRVLALQERTPHAPPLGPVAYAILLRAYGRTRDLENVEMSLRHARRCGVVPDLVLANTAVDAYVECGEVGRARGVVRSLTAAAGAGGGAGASRDLVAAFGDAAGEDRFWPCLRPNARTYNTLLKGLAKEGDVKGALKLSRLVRSKGLWDDITTNTLVKAAVTAREFDLAESVLANHTSAAEVCSSRGERSRGDARPHPNVEAYTELLDGYAKSDYLDAALRVMRVMQTRGVAPNEYTYTCVVGALARKNKVRQARKMIHHAATSLPAMTRRGGRRWAALTPTYNAFISGLLAGNGGPTADPHLFVGGQTASHAANMVEALAALQEMQRHGIRPNGVTVALVVDGLGRCTPPRCGEARALVQHLRHGPGAAPDADDGEGISLANYKIATAFVRAYGRAADTAAAAEAFGRIAAPDVVALNALLDAHCFNGELQPALELFRRHVDLAGWRRRREDACAAGGGPRAAGGAGDARARPLVEPDVVTYTTLLAALLALRSRAATRRAAALYDDMRRAWRISPDAVLVDAVLGALVGLAAPAALEEEDVRFVLLVLRDGARLAWEPGQYEKRKRAVRVVLTEAARHGGGAWWRRDGFAAGLVGEEAPEDPLFRKKGWNQIDSGFRLWGGRAEEHAEEEAAASPSSADWLLASKGWNDIESGWRWI